MSLASALDDLSAGLERAGREAVRANVLLAFANPNAEARRTLADQLRDQLTSRKAGMPEDLWAGFLTALEAAVATADATTLLAALDRMEQAGTSKS